MYGFYSAIGSFGALCALIIGDHLLERQESWQITAIIVVMICMFVLALLLSKITRAAYFERPAANVRKTVFVAQLPSNSKSNDS